MDNTTGTQTTEIVQATQTDTVTKKPFGRPKGSKKKLGLSLAERLKILEKIATSKDPEIKDCDKLGAVKLISDLLGDRVDPNERLLPIYTLRFELENKSGKVSDKSVPDAPNSPSEPVKVILPSPDMPVSVEPVIIQHTESEQDIGDTLKEDETGDLDSIF